MVLDPTVPLQHEQNDDKSCYYVIVLVIMLTFWTSSSVAHIHKRGSFFSPRVYMQKDKTLGLKISVNYSHI